MKKYIIKLISVLLGVLTVIWFWYNNLVLSRDALVFLFILIGLNSGKAQIFIKDWSFLLLYLYLYEILKACLPFFIGFFHIPIQKTLLLEWETFLFDTNHPVLWIQQLHTPYLSSLDLIVFFIHFSFFWSTFVVGYLLWRKSRSLFLRFRLGFVIMSFGALITFLLLPAYPPWLAAKEGYLPSMQYEYWEKLNIRTVYNFFISKVGFNPIAPFPSLHTAWPVFSMVFLGKLYRKKWGKWTNALYIYPLCMIFVLVYTWAHYFVDTLGGILYAIVAVKVADHYYKKKYTRHYKKEFVHIGKNH